MVEVLQVDIGLLKRAAPFSEYSGLISQDSTLGEGLKTYRQKIKDSMKKRGFDPSKPIDVWYKGNDRDSRDLIVVDGYTRFAIAEEVELQKVYVALHKFKDEKEALAYAIHNQEARRPSTDYTILIGVKMIEGFRRVEAGRKKTPGDGKKTIKETAAVLGVKRNKVEKARTIIQEAERTKDTKGIEGIRTGKKTINSAYRDAILARLNAYNDLKTQRGITSWRDPKDRQALAKEAGIGDGTANRFDYVSSKSPAMAKKVLEGKLTANAAYEQLRKMPPEKEAPEKEAPDKEALAPVTIVAPAPEPVPLPEVRELKTPFEVTGTLKSMDFIDLSGLKLELQDIPLDIGRLVYGSQTNYEHILKALEGKKVRIKITLE